MPGECLLGTLRLNYSTSVSVLRDTTSAERFQGLFCDWILNPLKCVTVLSLLNFLPSLHPLVDTSLPDLALVMNLYFTFFCVSLAPPFPITSILLVCLFWLHNDSNCNLSLFFIMKSYDIAVTMNTHFGQFYLTVVLKLVSIALT